MGLCLLNQALFNAYYNLIRLGGIVCKISLINCAGMGGILFMCASKIALNFSFEM
jgi:hypothetical protein